MTKTTPDIELYLIRHAESGMNTNPHLIGGRSNETLLTPKGIDQAKKLGRVLLKQSIIPLKVYASPAQRTLQTAHYCLAEMGLNIKPSISDAIQELAQGSSEGKPRAEVYTEAVLSQIAHLGKDFKLDGGESMHDVAQRLHDWTYKTFSHTVTGGKPEKYFVFTHGGAIKCFASHLENWDHTQTYQTPVDNTSINLFVRRDGHWQLEYLNRLVEMSTSPFSRHLVLSQVTVAA